MTERSRASALRLVGRVYWPRVTGLSFAFLAVSTFLYQREDALPYWVLLIAWGLIWPQVANQWAKRSADPLAFQIKFLFIDAFMIGFWVPLMSFNTIPTIAILSMHLLSIMSVMGLRTCLIGFLLEMIGIAVAVGLVGFNVQTESSTLQLLVSVPMLVLYPLFVGFNAYSLSLKLAAKQAVLRKLSITDGLTGLNNRRYWEEQVSKAFSLAKRNGSKASMVFADADHFKQINDDYGHGVGDEVLRKLAELVMDCARETDCCGRYGGEEFCIFLPDTDLDSARILAERVRQKIADEILHPEHQLHGTVSLGVATITNSMTSYQEWMEAADQALYVAKQQGRNRTITADTIHTN